MMRFLFFLLWVLLLFTGCSSLKNVKTSSYHQGINGWVMEVTGNQMPMKNAPARIAKGMITTVFIYEPTHISQVFPKGSSEAYTLINTKVVASVKTDSIGAFTIALPVGKYSVFVKKGNGYYANLLDADNNIALFVVEGEKYTTIKLTVSDKAVF